MKSFEAQLKELIKDLEEFPNDVAEEITELGDEFVAELEKTHKQGKDPYGVSWEPRKASYAWPILNKTGKLVGSYDSNKASNNKSVSISNTAEYAGYVDAKRKLLPDGEVSDSFMELMEEQLDKLVDDFNKS